MRGKDRLPNGHVHRHFKQLSILWNYHRSCYLSNSKVVNDDYRTSSVALGCADTSCLFFKWIQGDISALIKDLRKRWPWAIPWFSLSFQSLVCHHAPLLTPRSPSPPLPLFLWLDSLHSLREQHPAAAVHHRHFGFSSLQSTWQKPRSGRIKGQGLHTGSSLGSCSLFCTLVIRSFPRRYVLERFYPSNNVTLITVTPHSRCPHHLARRNLGDAENN